MKYTFLLGLSASIVLLLSSCSSLPVETIAPPVAMIPHGQSSQLTQGRDLYLGKCTKCHKPEPLRDYSVADLRDDILPSMCKKTKLSPEETAAVLAYCCAACQLPAPAPAPTGS